MIPHKFRRQVDHDGRFVLWNREYHDPRFAGQMVAITATHPDMEIMGVEVISSSPVASPSLAVKLLLSLPDRLRNEVIEALPDKLLFALHEAWQKGGTL